jgi:hypothetical protein
MLSSILSWLGAPIIEAIFGPIVKIAQAYIAKEVSEVEAKEKMVVALQGGVTQVEVSHSETLAKTYASFMDAMKSNVLMQTMWVTVITTQLFVLVWHQLGIPAVTFFTGAAYPSSGSTVEWAYALIGALMGLGPMVLRTGPAAAPPAWLDTIKGLILKK